MGSRAAQNDLQNLERRLLEVDSMREAKMEELAQSCHQLVEQSQEQVASHHAAVEERIHLL